MSDLVTSPFSVDSLKKYVENYLVDVPPNHMYARISYKVGGQIRSDVAVRVGENWRIGGSLAWNLKVGRVEEGSMYLMGSWE